MFGTLRFLLAIFVAISHMQLIHGFNIGVASVVIFYLLSGYVMTHSFLSNFDGKIQNVGFFYVDRMLRIYPLYLFYFCITVIFLLITYYGEPHFDFKSIIWNLLVVPLNFFMFSDAMNVIHDPVSKTGFNVIPPVWSLGAELQFYLLIPFIIKFRLIKILMPLSFLVFLFASFGEINTDYYGYRLLPGVLFIFLSGSLLYKTKHVEGNNINRLFLSGTFVAIALLLIVLSFSDIIINSYTLEVTFGLLFGILIIYFLSNVRLETNALKIDNLLGSLSYPIFLSHFITIWGLDYLITQSNLSIQVQGKVILQLFLTILISYIGYKFVDSPMQKLRKRIQNKSVNRIPKDVDIKA